MVINYYTGTVIWNHMYLGIAKIGRKRFML